MIRKFALILGIVYVAAGIMGFVPGLVQPAHDNHHLVVEANHGYLMGLFPINVLHNLVHLAVGAWGIIGSRSLPGAVRFARGLAIFYGLLAIMGMIPGANTMFGLVPIHGNDVWLHAVTALVAAYFGFVAPKRSAEAPAA